MSNPELAYAPEFEAQSHFSNNMRRYALAGIAAAAFAVGISRTAEAQAPTPGEAAIAAETGDPTVDRVNTNDPDYDNAMDRFNSDPMRSGEPWVGDSLPNGSSDPLERCVTMVRYADAQGFKYKPRKGSLRAFIYDGGIGQLCDLVGDYKTTVTLQAKKPSSNRYMTIDKDRTTRGMRRILTMYGMDNTDYDTANADFNVKGYCRKDANEGSKARVKVVAKYVPDNGQTFRHENGDPNGSSTSQKSLSRTVISKTIRICR